MRHHGVSLSLTGSAGAGSGGRLRPTRAGQRRAWLAPRALVVIEPDLQLRTIRDRAERPHAPSRSATAAASGEATRGGTPGDQSSTSGLNRCTRKTRLTSISTEPMRYT